MIFTGSSKSLLFLLPLSLEAHEYITIIIVPLVALRIDLVRRCRHYGIRTEEWHRDTRPPSDIRVLLVTPEAAMGESFTFYLNRLRTTGRLRRIVIDECHLILDANGVFRPAF